MTSPAHRRSHSPSNQPQFGRLRLNSIGTKLFLSTLAGLLVALGGGTLILIETLTEQLEGELTASLDTRVNEILSQLAPVEQHARALGSAVKVFQQRGVRAAEPYQQLALAALLEQPDLAFALGFGQTPFALLPDQEWFFPYYYRDQQVEGQVGTRLAAPYEDVFYSELFADNDYPNQVYYTVPVETGEPIWVEPYGSYGALLSSYATPIRSGDGTLIGITNVDINLARITEQLQNIAVMRQQGYFVILSQEGRIIAYPPAQPPPPPEGELGPSFETVAELDLAWPRVKTALANQNSGLLELDETGQYLAYRRVGNTSWTMMAIVPYGVVIGPVRTNTLIVALLAASLISVVIALFIRNLNRRLQPILDECTRLAGRDPALQSQIQQEDEIGRLSLSFFNLMKKLAANEQRIREEVRRTVETQEQLRQAEMAEAESQTLQQDVGRLLEVVSNVEDGDLTVRAEVNPRITGLVSDTLNRLIEQLAQILSQVVSTTAQVTQGSQQLATMAATVADNAQEQASEVVRVLQLTDEVEVAAKQSVVQGIQAKQALEEIQLTVERGQQAMTHLTQGIQTLQQGTENLIQSRQVITDFISLTDLVVKEQNQSATLTQTLAISAELLSARALAQQDPQQMQALAREFQALAKQIKILAQQTNSSLATLQAQTEQVQDLALTIDQDVQDLGHLVGDFTLGGWGINSNLSAGPRSYGQCSHSWGECGVSESTDCDQRPTLDPNHARDCCSI
ncbi:MAG: methyl-accepting chemotaxis protein [Synechococcaceae cyanobacterium SM2_3_1]|nr:methyl-accepting chemotaxis protein [Synechococcaceae cyanobacterium SM2_3_1]